MPYIKKEDRQKLDSQIIGIVNALTDRGFKNIVPGELNYALSSIIWKLWEQKNSYAYGSMLCGILDDVKHEFRRRKIDPYENTKIEENGDL